MRNKIIVYLNKSCQDTENNDSCNDRGHNVQPYVDSDSIGVLPHQQGKVCEVVTAARRVGGVGL